MPKLKRIFSSPLFWIITLTILLRLPTLFEPHYFFDEGIYAVVGKAWFQGAKLYSEIWDHKPPGIFVIYELSFVLESLTKIDILFWAKLAATLAVLGTEVLLYKIAKLALQEKEATDFFTSNTPTLQSSNYLISTLQFLPSILYLLLTSLPFYEGYLANTEIFMVFFVCLGAFFLLQKLLSPAQKNPPLSTNPLLWAGVFLGLGILFKPVALFDALFFVVLVAFIKPKDLLTLITGICLPLLITAFYFIFQGNFLDFWQTNITYNIAYATVVNQSLTSYSNLILLFSRLFILLLTSLYLFKKIPSSKVKKANFALPPIEIFSTWLIFDILGISLSLRPYLHYLIQAFPALAVLATFWLKDALASRRFQVSLSSLLISLSALTLLFIPINEKLKLTRIIPYQFDSFGYYQNFLNFIFGSKPKAEYLKFFDNGVLENQILKEKIKNLENTNRMDFKSKIFIWADGEAPWLYYDLKTTPPIPYTNYFHVESNPQGLRKTRQKLEKNLPRLIIFYKNAIDFDYLSKLLPEKYIQLDASEKAQIFGRID